jgi:hypothetical protein
VFPSSQNCTYKVDITDESHEEHSAKNGEQVPGSPAILSSLWHEQNHTFSLPVFRFFGSADSH